MSNPLQQLNKCICSNKLLPESLSMWSPYFPIYPLHFHTLNVSANFLSQKSNLFKHNSSFFMKQYFKVVEIVQATTNKTKNIRGEKLKLQ